MKTNSIDYILVTFLGLYLLSWVLSSGGITIYHWQYYASIGILFGYMIYFQKRSQKNTKIISDKRKIVKGER